MRPYYFLGNGRGLTRLSTNEVFFVDTDAHDISTWIILGGVWETFVDDILCALVRPGDTVLDVGANMGYYTIKMAARVGPEGRVFSFEPNPRLFRLVSDNLRINGFDGWGVATNAAAGAAKGVSTLTFERNYPGGGMVGLPSTYATTDVQDRIDVDVVRIDDVVPADQPVHLIKIDVEGFEPLVLQGMQAVLARSPDAAIVTEVNYQQWSQHGDPAELVKQMAGDRRIFRIYTDGAIEELAMEGIGDSLNKMLVSYVLLLPRTEERWRQVHTFERGYTPPPAPAEAEPDDEAPPTAPAEAQPDVQPVAPVAAPPTLGMRIRRRLARMIAPAS